MTSRHCAHTQTDKKSDMPGRVLLTWALAFTAIYVITYRPTYSQPDHVYIFITGVGINWCSTLFQLATSDFAFLFQVFIMASLIRASL